MSTVQIRMPEEEEGTAASIAGWLKQPGDLVTENEPLVEISTDKVTLEVPAPATGILRAHAVQPGASVAPGDLLGTIETAAEGAATDDNPTPAQTEAPSATPASKKPGTAADPEKDTTFSPVVRRLLAELNLDPAQVAKSTRGGRITPQDIAGYLASATQAKPAAPAAPPTAQAPPSARPGRLVPHTSMRRSIATHMARSVQVAPHVTSVFEADLFHIMADRERRKASGAGAVPSVTAYIIHAAIQSIQKFPEVNSRWHDDNVEIYDHVNFGVGTAIEYGGLVVPVLHDAHLMDLLTLSNRLRELTEKARTGKLTHADMAEGTFTLSNHGVSGSLLAAPIVLPHGQAAILGTGKLQKRVVVCENGGRDLFRVRPMMYVTLTVDHRVLDGQQTNGFLTHFVTTLEQPPTG